MAEQNPGKVAGLVLLSGFFGETSGVSGKQQVRESDGTGIEFEGLGGSNDLVAGGDELECLAKLDAGGFFRTFVDVAEQALEGIGVVFKRSDVCGDRFERADHAIQARKRHGTSQEK